MLRIAGLFLAAGLVAFSVWWWLARGFSWWVIAAIAFGLATASRAWRKLPAAATSEKDDRPMISLVLLRSKPRYLDAAVLAEVLRHAWGTSFDPAGGEAEPKEAARAAFIVGESPVFMVKTADGMFVVHNHEHPYFDDVANLAENIPELRLRTIVQQHAAWLSVDALGVDSPEEVAAAYRKIARAVAELADESTLGLYQPQANRLTPWEPALEGRLRNGENLDELFTVTQAPVVQISENDPRMIAAVAEARRRWPEFTAAFKARQPGGNYAVKAPITREGNTEFIWLEVIGLEPDYVHGRLANDPVSLGDLKLGDQVEVPISDVNDWTFCHRSDAEPEGLFTVKVLTESFAAQVKDSRAQS